MNIPFLFRAPPKIVAVAWASSTLHILSIRQQQQQWLVDDYQQCTFALPSFTSHDTPHDGNEPTSASWHDDWHRLFAQAVEEMAVQIASPLQVVVALPERMVVRQWLNISPDLRDDEREQEIQFLLDERLPFAIDDAYMDFCEMTHPQDETQGNVLCVATLQHHVQQIVACFKAVGWQVQAVESEQFALERSLSFMADYFPLGVQDVLVLHLDADRVLLHDYRHQRPQGHIHYFREHSIASPSQFGEMYAEALRALQYYQSSSHAQAIQYVLLAGRYANAEMVQQLQQQGYRVELANPIAQMHCAEQVNQTLLYQNAPQLLQACGLALRAYV
ncbi:MAG: pilus assembly protein PilM [Acinetobacter sp.]|nr:pilus assembly protein PilM [Acinetobacter sp.]